MPIWIYTLMLDEDVYFEPFCPWVWSHDKLPGFLPWCFTGTFCPWDLSHDNLLICVQRCFSWTCPWDLSHDNVLWWWYNDFFWRTFHVFVREIYLMTIRYYDVRWNSVQSGALFQCYSIRTFFFKYTDISLFAYIIYMYMGTAY